MSRKQAKTEEAQAAETTPDAGDAKPAPTGSGGPDGTDASGHEEVARRPRKRLQGRRTSTLAGVEAGIDNAFGAQPYIAFDNDRPATAEEKREMDSQGEGDPKFRYRSGQEKRWTGPATREGREKAETLAEKFIARRKALGEGPAR